MNVRRPPRLASALTVAAAAEALQGYGVAIFTPQIADTLAVAATSLLGARLLGLAVSAVLPATVRRPVITAWAARVAALAAAVTMALTGAVTGVGQLVGVLCVVAVLAAPAQTGVIATGSLAGAAILVAAGQVVMAGLVAVGAVDSWQTALEITAGVVTIAALIAMATDRPPDIAAADVSWKEALRAARNIRSMPGVLAALGAVALLLTPYDAVLAIDLRHRWHLGLHGAATVFVIAAATALCGLTLGRRRRSAEPARLAAQSSLALAGACALLALAALSPLRWLMVVGFALGTGVAALLLPAFAGLALATVPRRLHGQMSAAVAGVVPAGTAVGLVYATAFVNRHGARVALVALTVVGMLAALWCRGAASAVGADVRRASADDTASPHSSAVPALLECTGIDFSYGALQVLFDVDLTVDTGEIVALLGTNGAGKSTLLNVVSGLAMPQSGAVRFDGRDITYIDAEDRVRAGLTQIPGGRAVFGPMTVVDNLRSYGYTLGRDRGVVDEALDRCFATFPQLAARRSTPAARLSGGEQQMLGLCKALILSPRLLLIDELSLGLAPAVVGSLLDMVRRINAAGTAIVIVEQSVTLALSLVDRVCFMEKGAIRFDGCAADLLDRHDLLRAVFLEGAAKSVLR